MLYMKADLSNHFHERAQVAQPHEVGNGKITEPGVVLNFTGNICPEICITRSSFSYLVNASFMKDKNPGAVTRSSSKTMTRPCSSHRRDTPSMTEFAKPRFSSRS